MEHQIEMSSRKLAIIDILKAAISAIEAGDFGAANFEVRTAHKLISVHINDAERLLETENGKL